MNKTFKVVFNKARGALMVVNEATSSVQKKGTKTVVAAAVAAMIAGVAGNVMALEQSSSLKIENSSYTINGIKTAINSLSDVETDDRYAAFIINEGLIDSPISVDDITVNVTASSLEADRIYGLAFEGQHYANIKNVDINVSVLGDEQELRTFRVNTTRGNPGQINIDGPAKIKATTAGLDSTIYAVDVWQSEANFNGDVDINVNAGASYVYTVYVNWGGTINFNGDNTVVSSVTDGHLNKPFFPGATPDGYYQALEGVKAQSGTVRFNGKKVSLSSIAKNDTNTSSATALRAEAGVIVSSADEMNLQAKTEKGFAIGLFSSQSNVTIDGETLKICSETQNGAAYGVYTTWNSDVKFESNDVIVSALGNHGLSVGISSENHYQSTPSSGFYPSGRKIEFKNNASVSASGLNAFGVRAIGSKAINQTSQDVGINIKFDNDLRIVSESLAENGIACGIYADAKNNYGDEELDLHQGRANVIVNGDLNLLVRGGGELLGLAAINGASCTVYGNAIISAENGYAIYAVTDNAEEENAEPLLLSESESEVSSQISLNGSVNSLTGRVVADNGAVTLGGSTTINWSDANEPALLVTNNGSVSITGHTVVPTIKITRSDTDNSSVTVTNGTLQTSTDQLFKLGGKSLISADVSKINATTAAFVDGLTLTDSALAVTDTGYYTNATLDLMKGATGVTALTIVNATLAPTEEAKLVDGVVQAGSSAVVDAVGTAGQHTVTSEGKGIIQSNNGGLASVTIQDALRTDPNIATDVEIQGNLTLVGDNQNSALIKNEKGQSVDSVTVETGHTLNLGSATVEKETSGTLPKMTIAGTVNVTNITSTISEVETKEHGTINIGTNDNRGALKTGKLTLASGSTIFLDPAWANDAQLDVIGNASHLEIANGADSSLAGNLIAGQNSLITYGATAADATNMFARLSDLSWGADNVTSALYLGQTMKVADTGRVIVNGSLTAVPGDFNDYVEGGVTLAANSLLMINQAGIGAKAIDGKLKINAGADDVQPIIGIVNATEGSFTVATSIEGTLKKDNFVLDNQFVDIAKWDRDTALITLDVDEEYLSNAIGSMGISQMARRTDSVFANTIADRTAQTIVGEGVSLWADVGGERYEADKLANNVQYKSNMFYGAFGADVGLNANARIGAALQYGTGDSKSKNFNIKNDIDAISVGLYGTYNFNENMKVVGELAYTKNSNEITASERLLNNDIDAEVFSVGFRGQHDFKVGALNITPSVGIRFTNICYDDFNVGGIKLDLDNQSLVQVPISVAFSADIDQNGWMIKPYAKVSLNTTFGDDEIDVRGYKQDVLDMTPVQGDFGLSATNGKVTFGASLSAGFGQDGAQSFGGKVGVRYAF